MKDFILENIFSIIATLFGGGSLFGWITERSKRRSEERQIAAEALKTMQEAYDEFTKDSMDRYNTLKEEVKELKARLEYIQKVSAEEKLKHRQLQKEFDEYKLKYPGKE